MIIIGLLIMMITYKLLLVEIVEGIMEEIMGYSGVVPCTGYTFFLKL